MLGRRAVQSGLALATSYFLVDAAEELLLWSKCRGLVHEAANASAILKQEIGNEIQPGYYWDSSLRLTHRGNVMHCTVPVHGEKGASDAHIKLIKPYQKEYVPGQNLAYTFFSKGEWQVLMHYAVIAGAGAVPKHIDLTTPEQKHREEESEPTR